jgi:predicted exporter
MKNKRSIIILSVITIISLIFLFFAIFRYTKKDMFLILSICFGCVSIIMAIIVDTKKKYIIY